jgi:hypothetical protein
MNGNCSIFGRLRAARRASAPPRVRRVPADASGAIEWLASASAMIRPNQTQKQEYAIIRTDHRPD